MTGDVRFEPDLYRGTAGYYDRFRLPYPDAMIADLVRRAAPSGNGRLLDLACGTGQLAFPLRGLFADVWCVDAEPGTTAHRQPLYGDSGGGARGDHAYGDAGDTG
ncbi:hypothetical protein ACWERA_55830, partial [Streptomyces mirabilis]